MADEIIKSTDTNQGNSSLKPTPEPKKPSSYLPNLKRELSNSDLKNTAVGKLLLNENDRCYREIAELREYKEKFHAADKTAAVCAMDLKGTTRSINVRSALFTLSGIILGGLFTIWSYGLEYFIPAAIIGVLLFGAAMWGKS